MSGDLRRTDGRHGGGREGRGGFERTFFLISPEADDVLDVVEVLEKEAGWMYKYKYKLEVVAVKRVAWSCDPLAKRRLSVDHVQR